LFLGIGRRRKPPQFKERSPTNGQAVPCQERSVASHVALVHLWVMPSGDVLARILGVAAKDVVALDLLGL
jgi:hypothetical protein